VRAVVQRVSRASCEVDGRIVGQIDRGLLIYLGVEKGDTEKEAAFMAEKILNLRIFPDQEKRMNLSVMDIGGQVLSISQFTLASYIKKGRRPDFAHAEEPQRADALYRHFNLLLSQQVKVQTGIFAAMMNISSINDGPVTFIIERRSASPGPE